MKIRLLYEDREYPEGSYYDWSSIIKDLGLNFLFDAAKPERNGNRLLSKEEEADALFLADTMKQIMKSPLTTEAEIRYRQAAVMDSLRLEETVKKVYELSCRVLRGWDALGRKVKGNGSNAGKAALIMDIKAARHLFDGMTELKAILDESREEYSSKAFMDLYEEISDVMSEEKAGLVGGILNDMSFYTDEVIFESAGYSYKMAKPRVVLDCGISEGLKLCDIKLQEFTSNAEKFRNPNGIVARIQNTINTFGSTFIPLGESTRITENMEALEMNIVRYVSRSIAWVIREFGDFFDVLHYQIAFYCGIVNIKKRITRHGLEYCYPSVCAQNKMSFDGLKEVVMRLMQQCEIIGNTTDVSGKMLLIITGANQGGKSTYLRSIGIAQIMMQAGMFVAANRFESGLFPNFYTHFTRREDSAMNSGRLDEELRRMDRIISNIGPDSLMLLNESFASTTEKEGSMIAYDIIRALKEEGVKIITVTHLLTFAKQIYAEYADDLENCDVAFMTAERLDDGRRTYKMIPHEPELTSFGLDLYDRIVGEEA